MKPLILSTLSHTDRIDAYEVELKIHGSLKGVKIDLLWECVASKRAYLEMETQKQRAAKKAGESNKMPKILVLDLEKIGAIVQIFDELGITVLTDHKLERPSGAWLTSMQANLKDYRLPSQSPINWSISEADAWGEKFTFTAVPEELSHITSLSERRRSWLERFRLMYLNGILADDMGLGKTLQAIVAITQYRMKKESSVAHCLPHFSSL